MNSVPNRRLVALARSRASAAHRAHRDAVAAEKAAEAAGKNPVALRWARIRTAERLAEARGWYADLSAEISANTTVILDEVPDRQTSKGRKAS